MNFRILHLALTLLLLASSVLGSEGYAPSKGVKIYYRTFGEGEPLLIINGGPGYSSEGFIPLAQELSKGYQTILYDQRGTGKSSLAVQDSTTISMDLMTEDIEALRKHLGIKQWIVMGHSFGGMMANYYAAKHPDRVEAIVASSSGGLNLSLLTGLGITSRLSQLEKDSLDYWTARVRGGDTSYTARLNRGKYLAPAYLYNREYIPVVADRLTQGSMSLNSLVWSDLQRIKYDVTDELSDFDKPVLIIQGAEDVLPLKVAEIARDTFPNSKMVILERCGHYGWLDRRERYFTEIRTFLASISANGKQGK